MAFLLEFKDHFIAKLCLPFAQRRLTIRNLMCFITHGQILSDFIFRENITKETITTLLCIVCRYTAAMNTLSTGVDSTIRFTSGLFKAALQSFMSKKPRDLGPNRMLS